MNKPLSPARLALVTVLLLCTFTRADDKAAKESADLKRLEGTWTMKSGTGGDDVVYTFKGDQLNLKAPSRSYKMTVKLDEGAKPHKTIDFRIDDGPDDAKGKTSKGIYRFDGDDKFVFCIRPEGERPDKFEQVGEEQFLMELKKQDKKDK